MRKLSERSRNLCRLSKNADKLQKEFENAVGGLGEIDYFALPESGIMMMNEAAESKAAKASGLKNIGKGRKRRSENSG